MAGLLKIKRSDIACKVKLLLTDSLRWFNSSELVARLSFSLNKTIVAGWRVYWTDPGFLTRVFYNCVTVGQRWQPTILGKLSCIEDGNLEIPMTQVAYRKGFISAFLTSTDLCLFPCVFCLFCFLIFKNSSLLPLIQLISFQIRNLRHYHALIFLGTFKNVQRLNQEI